jgi:hypothetical protein
MKITRLISTLFYLMVGFTSLMTAMKNLVTVKLLPFHEKACKTPWNEIDLSLQDVILAIIKAAGPGFFAVGALLWAAAPANLWRLHPFSLYGI